MAPLETTVPWPSGNGAWSTPRKPMVRLPLWAQRLGRQLADHLGLEPGMLWVQLPPEPLEREHALVEQPGVLACLSRRRSRVQIPPGALSTNMARYAKKAKRPSSNLGDLRVRLPPAPLEQHATIGHWQAQLAVTQPSLEDLQVQLLLVALTTWPVRLSAQDASPSSWRGGFDSRTGYLNMTMWWNW